MVFLWVGKLPKCCNEEYYHKSIKKDLDKNKLCESIGIALIRIREPELPSLNSSSIDFIIDNLTSDHSYMNKVINELLHYLNIKNILIEFIKVNLFIKILKNSF